jgi:hypothetical protein
MEASIMSVSQELKEPGKHIDADIEQAASPRQDQKSATVPVVGNKSKINVYFNLPALRKQSAPAVSGIVAEFRPQGFHQENLIGNCSFHHFLCLPEIQSKSLFT